MPPVQTRLPTSAELSDWGAFAGYLESQPEAMRNNVIYDDVESATSYTLQEVLDNPELFDAEKPSAYFGVDNFRQAFEDAGISLRATQTRARAFGDSSAYTNSSTGGLAGPTIQEHTYRQTGTINSQGEFTEFLDSMTSDSERQTFLSELTGATNVGRPDLNTVSPQQALRIQQLDLLTDVMKTMGSEFVRDHNQTWAMWVATTFATSAQLSAQQAKFSDITDKLIPEAMQKIAADPNLTVEQIFPNLVPTLASLGSDSPGLALFGYVCDMNFADVSNEAELNALRAQVMQFERGLGNFEAVRQTALDVLKPEFDAAIKKIPAERVAEIKAEAEDNIREQAQAEGATGPDVEGLLQSLIADETNRLLVDEAISNHFSTASIPVGKRAVWDQFNDCFDPTGEYFNVSDENRNFIIQEVLINAPLIIASGGIASLARSGVATMGRATWFFLESCPALARYTTTAAEVASRVIVNGRTITLAGRTLQIGTVTTGSVASTVAGTTVEGLVFEMTNQGLHGEWLFNSPNWAQQVMWSSLTLGLFHGAGKLGEGLLAKESSLIVKDGTEITLSAGPLRAIADKITNKYVREAFEELLVKGHIEVATMLLIGAVQNGAYSGSLEEFFHNFPEELFHAYVSVLSLKTSGKLSGKAIEPLNKRVADWMAKKEAKAKAYTEAKKASAAKSAQVAAPPLLAGPISNLDLEPFVSNGDKTEFDADRTQPNNTSDTFSPAFDPVLDVAERLATQRDPQGKIVQAGERFPYSEMRQVQAYLEEQITERYTQKNLVAPLELIALKIEIDGFTDLARIREELGTYEGEPLLPKAASDWLAQLDALQSRFGGNGPAEIDALRAAIEAQTPEIILQEPEGFEINDPAETNGDGDRTEALLLGTKPKSPEDGEPTALRVSPADRTTENLAPDDLSLPLPETDGEATPAMDIEVEAPKDSRTDERPRSVAGETVLDPKYISDIDRMHEVVMAIGDTLTGEQAASYLVRLELLVTTESHSPTFSPEKVAQIREQLTEQLNETTVPYAPASPDAMLPTISRSDFDAALKTTRGKPTQLSQETTFTPGDFTRFEDALSDPALTSEQASRLLDELKLLEQDYASITTAILPELIQSVRDGRYQPADYNADGQQQAGVIDALYNGRFIDLQQRLADIANQDFYAKWDRAENAPRQNPSEIATGDARVDLPDTPAQAASYPRTTRPPADGLPVGFGPEPAPIETAQRKSETRIPASAIASRTQISERSILEMPYRDEIYQLAEQQRTTGMEHGKAFYDGELIDVGGESTDRLDFPLQMSEGGEATTPIPFLESQPGTPVPSITDLTMALSLAKYPNTNEVTVPTNESENLHRAERIITSDVLLSGDIPATVHVVVTYDPANDHFTYEVNVLPGMESYVPEIEANLKKAEAEFLDASRDEQIAMQHQKAAAPGTPGAVRMPEHLSAIVGQLKRGDFALYLIRNTQPEFAKASIDPKRHATLVANEDGSINLISATDNPSRYKTLITRGNLVPKELSLNESWTLQNGDIVQFGDAEPFVWIYPESGNNPAAAARPNVHPLQDGRPRSRVLDNLSANTTVFESHQALSDAINNLGEGESLNLGRENLTRGPFAVDSTAFEVTATTEKGQGNIISREHIKIARHEGKLTVQNIGKAGITIISADGTITDVIPNKGVAIYTPGDSMGHFGGIESTDPIALKKGDIVVFASYSGYKNPRAGKMIGNLPAIRFGDLSEASGRASNRGPIVEPVVSQSPNAPSPSDLVEVTTRDKKKYVGFVRNIRGADGSTSLVVIDERTRQTIEIKSADVLTIRGRGEDLTKQNSRVENPQYRDKSVNRSGLDGEGMWVLVDFANPKLATFLKTKMQPIYEQLASGKMTREQAALAAYETIKTNVRYDEARKYDALPNQTYTLGEFLDTGVCNEMAMLLQVSLQYIGIQSQMEKGSSPMGGGRHAWVRTVDANSPSYILDPAMKSTVQKGEPFYTLYQDDGTPFAQPKVGTIAPPELVEQAKPVAPKPAGVPKQGDKIRVQIDGQWQEGWIFDVVNPTTGKWRVYRKLIDLIEIDPTNVEAISPDPNPSNTPILRNDPIRVKIDGQWQEGWVFDAIKPNGKYSVFRRDVGFEDVDPSQVLQDGEPLPAKAPRRAPNTPSLAAADYYDPYETPNTAKQRALDAMGKGDVFIDHSEAFFELSERIAQESFASYDAPVGEILFNETFNSAEKAELTGAIVDNIIAHNPTEVGIFTGMLWGDIYNISEFIPLDVSAVVYKDNVQKLKKAGLDNDYNLPAGFGDADFSATGFTPKSLLDALSAGDSRDFFLSKLMARGKADFAASKDAYKTILREAGFPAERLADLNTALDGASNFADFQAKAKKLPKEWEAKDIEAARVARAEQQRAEAKAARDAEAKAAAAAKEQADAKAAAQAEERARADELRRQTPEPAPAEVTRLRDTEAFLKAGRDSSSVFAAAETSNPLMTSNAGGWTPELVQEFSALALQDVPAARAAGATVDARTLGQRISITLGRLSELGYTPRQCLEILQTVISNRADSTYGFEAFSKLGTSSPGNNPLSSLELTGILYGDRPAFSDQTALLPEGLPTARIAHILTFKEGALTKLGWTEAQAYDYALAVSKFSPDQTANGKTTFTHASGMLDELVKIYADKPFTNEQVITALTDALRAGKPIEVSLQAVGLPFSDPNTSYNIAEIGPGIRPMHHQPDFALQENQTYTALDQPNAKYDAPIWSRITENNGEHIALRHGDRENTGLPDESFDEVVMLGSHDGASKASAEIDRILKPNGVVRLGVGEGMLTDLQETWGKALIAMGYMQVPAQTLSYSYGDAVSRYNGINGTNHQVQGDLPYVVLTYRKPPA